MSSADSHKATTPDFRQRDQEPAARPALVPRITARIIRHGAAERKPANLGSAGASLIVLIV
jgi:hypothetical protein